MCTYTKSFITNKDLFIVTTPTSILYGERRLFVFLYLWLSWEYHDKNPSPFPFNGNNRSFNDKQTKKHKLWSNIILSIIVGWKNRYFHCWKWKYMVHSFLLYKVIILLDFLVNSRTYSKLFDVPASTNYLKKPVRYFRSEPWCEVSLRSTSKVTTHKYDGHRGKQQDYHVWLSKMFFIVPTYKFSVIMVFLQITTSNMI